MKRLGGFLAPSFLLLGIFIFAIGALLLHSLYTYEEGQILKVISLKTYKQFFIDRYYLKVILDTFKLGFVVMTACLLVGYPVAYALNKIENIRLLLICSILIFSPLLVSVVVRAYGWLLLLSSKGAVNYLLQSIGLIREPIQFMFNFTGVAISMIHILLPFMVFSIVSVLRQQDPALKEAAMDLGANRFQSFYKITLPLSLTGVVSGCQMVFVLAISAFVTPAVLGGGRVNVLARGIYQDTIDLNWPMAAVGAVTLLGLVFCTLLIFNYLIQLLRK